MGLKIEFDWVDLYYMLFFVILNLFLVWVFTDFSRDYYGKGFEYRLKFEMKIKRV